MNSFSRRIERSTLLLIALLLLIFDVVVYVGFHQVLHHHVDSKLEAMAEGWADIARRNLGMLQEASQKGQDTPVQSAIPDEGEQIEFRDAALSIEVMTLEGTVLWKGAAVIHGPPAAPEYLAQAQAGESVFATVTNHAGALIRRVWVPIVQHGKAEYILQAEMSLRFVEQALTGLAILLATASVLFLMLAWFASNWLTKQALMPVEVLSLTALRIAESSSLNTRLALDGGYDEFRRLTQAFNRMMDRIERMVEAQRRFVTDAAHEIQTPLTALKGNLEVAFRKNRRASEYRETLIANLGAVERLMNLCRSLIALTRLAGANARLPQEAVDLHSVLAELVEDMVVLAHDRHIELSLEAHPTPLIRANREQLQRLFINLLDNAIRHTPQQGKVRTRLIMEDNHVVVRVSDSGEGIGPDHLPHIFERFYRVDTARSREQGGTGLGLAIVKEIVEAHEAEIRVESELGKGSTFTIRFPSSSETHADPPTAPDAPFQVISSSSNT